MKHPTAEPRLSQWPRCFGKALPAPICLQPPSTRKHRRSEMFTSHSWSRAPPEHPDTCTRKEDPGCCPAFRRGCTSSCDHAALQPGPSPGLGTVHAGVHSCKVHGQALHGGVHTNTVHSTGMPVQGSRVCSHLQCAGYGSMPCTSPHVCTRAARCSARTPCGRTRVCTTPGAG